MEKVKLTCTGCEREVIADFDDISLPLGVDLSIRTVAQCYCMECDPPCYMEIGYVKGEEKINSKYDAVKVVGDSCPGVENE